MAPPVCLVRGNLGPGEGVLSPQVNSTSGEYRGRFSTILLSVQTLCRQGHVTT